MRFSFGIARCVAVGFAYLPFASHAVAAFVVPAFRDDPPPVTQSSYQQWDTFAPPGPILSPFAPDVTTHNAVNTNNPFGTPLLTVTSTNSVATSSSMNVYSPSGPGTFSLTLPSEAGSFNWTKVVVQVLGRGTELDVNSLQLTGASGTYTPDPTAVLISETIDPNPFGGLIQETWFQFLLPTHDTSYVLSLASEEGNFSLDQIAVDMQWGLGMGTLEELPLGDLILLETSSNSSAVPEPSTGLILAVGTLGWCAMQRRRRARSEA